MIGWLELFFILVVFGGIGYVIGNSIKRKKIQLNFIGGNTVNIIASQSADNLFPEFDIENQLKSRVKKSQSNIFDEYLSNKLKNIADSQAEDLQIKLPEALESLNNKSITLYCFKANDSNMTKLIEESIEKFYKYFENGKCNKTFELIKKIGKGKNSIVYKAKHLLDGQFYAVKIIKLYVGIKENIQEQKMFREVLSMAKLNSKYLLRYHSSWIELESPNQNLGKNDNKFVDLDQLDEPYFIFYLVIQTELSSGITLQDWLQDEKRSISSSTNIDIFKQLVKGVQCIHSNNFIHRDLKPANIFISNDLKIKIGDFGLTIIAKHDTENADCSNYYNGLIPRNPSLDVTNKNYRAPELLTQECSQKMDIYALGLILFELYSCSSSLEKEFYFKQLQHNHQLPDKYDMTNPHIAKLILLFTEPDPNKRPTISEFMNDDLL